MLELIESLGTGGTVHRIRIRERLREIGAVEPLIDAMKYHTDKRIQQESASVLMMIYDARVAHAMLDALSHPNIVVAQTAVEALEKYVDMIPVKEFVHHLPNCRPLIQLNLITLMMKRKDLQIVPALMNILQETVFPTLRYTIIQALGQMGDPQVIPLIETFTKDNDHHVRKQAQIALNQLLEKR